MKNQKVLQNWLPAYNKMNITILFEVKIGKHNI